MSVKRALQVAVIYAIMKLDLLVVHVMMGISYHQRTMQLVMVKLSL